MFSKKASKIDEIFTDNLTLCSKCQINGEDFVNFCGLLRKHELYVRILGCINEYGRTCGAENNHQHEHIKKFTEYKCEVVLVHLIVKFCEE